MALNMMECAAVTSGTGNSIFPERVTGIVRTAYILDGGGTANQKWHLEVRQPSPTNNSHTLWDQLHDMALDTDDDPSVALDPRYLVGGQVRLRITRATAAQTFAQLLYGNHKYFREGAMLIELSDLTKHLAEAKCEDPEFQMRAQFVSNHAWAQAFPDYVAGKARRTRCATPGSRQDGRR